MSDVIDQLAGPTPDSALSTIRGGRPQARANAEASFRALFEPNGPGGVTAAERFALASFVAGLHGDEPGRAFYAERLAAEASHLIAPLEREAERGRTAGPYGAFPPGPLSAEDQGGAVFAPSEEGRAALGRRLSAALAHAHLLVFRPRDASGAALQELLDAGWSTAEIVTLSQLVAFLSFQFRTAAGLRVLARATA